ncbi:hypothetical protein P7K49_036393 [Saguinus oedipus]|uniref:Metallothionein n=1 Tax=Saguinus oedipus TaxID=9490 RepID=A0ABQ9TK42_SAGOE|nr:hypothetical protein P7K49_036393 [Saguinus oedipus]
MDPNCSCAAGKGCRVAPAPVPAPANAECTCTSCKKSECRTISRNLGAGQSQRRDLHRPEQTNDEPPTSPRFSK